MQYNDYELISLAREGNEEAINLIYQKYKPIIVSKSTDAIVTATHHGIEISDIMQEGFIGLEEAINNFSEQDNTSFYTFAVLCINRQIINYLRKNTRGKNKILNDAVVIDEVIEKSIRDDSYNMDIFMSRDIIDDIKNNLTELEYTVVKMKLDGYNFEEIANTLNKDLKSVYNTFHRAKSKIRKLIDEDDCL